MNSPRGTEATRCWLPWRSAQLGWGTTVAILIVGLPLFLRMPLWCDATLYNIAAREVLRGGVHYRDVFDTNLPGFLWVNCGLQVLLEPQTEVLRGIDVVVVTCVTFLLLGWARAAGATPAALAWASAGAGGLYLFVSESNHCQRDVWMMLPAVIAARVRLWRSRRVATEGSTRTWAFLTGVAEGTIWGLAVWIKPHMLLVALGCWLVSQPRLGRPLADLTGSLLGGLLVGAGGVAWLVGTGAWPYFLDVFRNWNTSYVQNIFAQLGFRFEQQLNYFPPWSLLFVVTVPLAVLNLIDAPIWSQTSKRVSGFIKRWLPSWLYDDPSSPESRFTRAVLAAMYLSWVGMALFLQKPYHYVHLPETLLMLALFAANRWGITFFVVSIQVAVLAWLALIPTPIVRWDEQPVAVRHVLWQYPDGNPDRIRWWNDTLRPEIAPQVRNQLAFQSEYFAAINVAELAEVEDYLRSQRVKDYEVMCWHDSPHALYLGLDIRPPIRFMHLSTATEMGDAPYERVKQEVTAAVASGRVRFVVSDLARVFHFAPPEDKARMSEPAQDLIPPVVPANCRRVFPLNQPAVFRSRGGGGRYAVHAIEKPVGEVYVPYWVRAARE